MSLPPAASDEITRWGAAEIARRIAAGEISSVEVTQAFIARIEAVNPQINAVAVSMFETALLTARECDEAQAQGRLLGALHGVPLSVKECFQVIGTPATIGIERFQNELAKEEGLLVQRLRAAGGVLLAKTNIPQLMIWHECDNPVYGRTNNPWDLGRTPGGSTGGEAALIAAGGSPLGLGNDLGGSIRVPCHFCGIAGIKPTSYRLPRGGTRATLLGMEALVTQAGPMARRVEDLTLGLRVLAQPAVGEIATHHAIDSTAPFPLGDPQQISIAGTRIAMFTDDGFFPASAAIQRAVLEAAEALRSRGAIVEPFQPPRIEETLDTYISLLGADGGAGARRLVGNSQLDWRVARLMWIASLSSPTRWALVNSSKRLGQNWMARLVALARGRSADSYWRLIHRKNELAAAFLQEFRAANFDAFLCPPHALPAIQHGKPIDLLVAASYAFLANFVGLPAGVVPVTRVRQGEDGGRHAAIDKVKRQAAAVDRGSRGLPIGVQVAALPWREDLVLALLGALEEHFQTHDDYPCRERVPTGS